MDQFGRRIWIAATLMILGWCGTYYVRSGYTFEVQKLSQELVKLPKELLGYLGTDITIDDEIQKELNASSWVNREYRRADGHTMIVHSAAWTSPEEVSEVVPHHPSVCYTSAGWSIVEQRSFEIETPAGKRPIGMMLLERNKEYCVLGYWYQMGTSTFSSLSEGKRVHREYWGKRTWPTTIKMMLQVSAKDIDSGALQIEPIAVKLFQWVASL